MIFTTQPANFQPQFTVGSCFVEADGKILLLKRKRHKDYGGTWGMPAGKIDGDVVAETIRELSEETGLKLDLSDLESLGAVFVRFPEYDFIYHIHRTVLPSQPAVSINPDEHDDFDWVSPCDAEQKELVPDLDWCIELVYGSKTESREAA